MKTSQFVGAGVMLVALVGFPSASGVTGDTDPRDGVRPPPGETWETVRANEDLSGVLRRLREAGDGVGASAIIPDKSARTISVFWKVPVPAEVRAFDGEYLAGYRVSVRDAKVGEQEAVDAGVRWMDHSRVAGLPGPSEVGVDLSGQAVRVAYLQRDIDEYGSETLREQAEAVMGLPARVVASDDFFLTSARNGSDGSTV